MSSVNLVLLDDPSVRSQLLPFTYTRPIAEIRVGILTIREKWQHHLKTDASVKTENYLASAFALNINPSWNTLTINSCICPDADLVEQIEKLPGNSVLMQGEFFIASNSEASQESDLSMNNLTQLKAVEYSHKLSVIRHPWEIFQSNEEQLSKDFLMLTHGRTSAPLAATNMLIGPPKNLFIEEEATLNGAIINVQDGPVYIGKNAEVMEGSTIRGGLALCESATLKMGAKVYGATTIGPHSKVGGEVNNVVIFGYSNKGHDGFLGNSVIGEWCNLGADTNTSNLKNNYGNVRVWSYREEDYIDTGLQFCGLIMGDHAKSGINVMFNTGTVVGVSANIYGSGFPPKFIPSFTWGAPGAFVDYKLDKAFEVARRVMARRKKAFSKADESMLIKVHEYSKQYRQTIQIKK